MGNKCCFLQNKIKIDPVEEWFNISNYNPIFLGYGSSGNAYKINIEDVYYTCKKINKQYKNLVSAEIQILKSIKHDKYFPNFYKCVESKNNFNIIYQFIEGVELFGMIDTLLKTDTPVIIREISLGLNVLFKYNYIHLDIKPENIIITQINPIKLKLIDLAFCRKINESNNFTEMCGTKGYMSPEVVFFNRFFHNTDVWSLGIIFHVLLTKKTLFKDNSFIQELKHFTKLDDLPLLGRDCFDLLRKMLTKNPALRISINDVIKHSFIK